MKFIHAVVFQKDVFEGGHYDTSDWGDLTDGDYVVHALYDCENHEVVRVNDNCHSHIEAEIDAFLNGIERCGHEVQEVFAYIVLKEGHYDEYNETDIISHIEEGLYAEVWR